MTRAAALTFLDQTARLMARAVGQAFARTIIAALVWVLVFPLVGAPDLGPVPWLELAGFLLVCSILEQIIAAIHLRAKA